MSIQYRIVFKKVPGYTDKLYYRRDEDVVIDARHTTRPELTLNVVEAHTFSSRDSVSAFREKFREIYKTEKYEIFVEDSGGVGPLFEREEVAADTGEDTRTRLVICPDDLIASDLWFVVRPATLPTGRCWCVSPLDVPSLEESSASIDTFYGRVGEMPEDVLERARRHWEVLGLKVEGSPYPYADQRDREETKQILQEFNQANNPGRLRRPDLR